MESEEEAPLDLSGLDGTDYRPPRHGSDEARLFEGKPQNEMADRFLDELRGRVVEKAFWGHAGRPGKRGGSLPADVAARTLTDTKTRGGSTISLKGHVPKKGFVVAGVTGADGKPHERQIENPKRKDVVDYIKENLAELQKPNRYLGAWAYDGKTFLDTPEVYDSRERALEIAHLRKEIAIWDIENKAAIYTMSDQKRPGESEGTEIRKDDGEGHYLIVGPGLSAEQMADEVMAFFESQESPKAGDPPASLAETHGDATNALAKLAKAKKRETT